MINVSVAGVAGRMGGRIAALCLENPEIKLTGAFEREGHEAVGKDIGSVIGSGIINMPTSESITDTIESADTVIDFTTVESTLQNIKECVDKGKSIVIGTTGLIDKQMHTIKGFSRDIPIVYAPNMSVGINLLLKVIRDITKTIGNDYDIEIIEAHHRLKKDAPSGTAVKFSRIIAETLNRDLDKVAVYTRKGLIGERAHNEIGIQTIRAGDIVGEHTVMFGGLGERIEITHKASSRDTFARGAIKAALWLKDKSAGLYDMQDVLGLK